MLSVISSFNKLSISGPVMSEADKKCISAIEKYLKEEAEYYATQPRNKLFNNPPPRFVDEDAMTDEIY